MGQSGKTLVFSLPSMTLGGTSSTASIQPHRRQKSEIHLCVTVQSHVHSVALGWWPGLSLGGAPGGAAILSYLVVPFFTSCRLCVSLSFVKCRFQSPGLLESDTHLPVTLGQKHFAFQQVLHFHSFHICEHLMVLLHSPFDSSVNKKRHRS